MNLKRTTTIAVVGAALIAWLAGAATSNRPIPTVPVIQQTNIEKRGYGSVTSEAAVGMVAGFGVDSYVLALEAMVSRLRKLAGG